MAHPVGRPRKFKSVKELQDKIDLYFESCRGINKETGEEVYIRPLTITGLALALDTTRDVLLDYQNDPDLKEFSYTIKRAKQIIESYAEEQLYSNPRTAGVIFAMKNNYGWVDKTESTVDQKISGSLDIDSLPSSSLLKQALEAQNKKEKKK